MARCLHDGDQQSSQGGWLRVPGMWGNVRPRWRLLQQHLEAAGLGWYSVAEREERLFTNRSNQPGDDMKDEVRTDDDWHACRIWRTTRDRLWRLRREEEHVISVQFLGSQQDVSTSRKKKRKQVEDAPART